MNEQTVTLDVRAEIRAGRQPCSTIMAAVASLKPDQSLRLLAPFEPKPLFELLAQQGFAHQSRPLGDDDWEVLFVRDASLLKCAAQTLASQSSDPACGCGAAAARRVVEVNVRGFEPPQPMVRILEALDTLPDGAQLRAHTDRRPVHLYPMLAGRGFAGESEEQSDGSFITHIRRQ